MAHTHTHINACIHIYTEACTVILASQPFWLQIQLNEPSAIYSKCIIKCNGISNKNVSVDHLPTPGFSSLNQS